MKHRNPTALQHRLAATLGGLSILALPACGEDLSPTTPREYEAEVVGWLDLPSGTRVVFVDEDPFEGVEIGVLEIVVHPEDTTPATVMVAEESTPLELWMGLTDDAPPSALKDDFLRLRGESVHPRALEGVAHRETRNFDYPCATAGGTCWGEYDDYCGEDYQDHFLAFAQGIDASAYGEAA